MDFLYRKIAIKVKEQIPNDFPYRMLLLIFFFPDGKHHASLCTDMQLQWNELKPADDMDLYDDAYAEYGRIYGLLPLTPRYASNDLCFWTGVPGRMVLLPREKNKMCQ